MKSHRRIEADSNGNLIMSYWSGGQWVVKTKGRTGSTWTVIPIGGSEKCYISYGTDTSAADKIKEAYDASIDIFLAPMNVTTENVAVEVPLTSYKYVQSTGVVTAQFAQPINSSIYEFDVTGTVGSNNSAWSNTSKRIQGTPYESKTASTTTLSIYPNVETYFSNALTGSKTFSLVQPTDQTISNFYFWSFTAASSVTITWPSGIKWANNSIPEYDSSYITEVLVSQNRGTWLKYPV